MELSMGLVMQLALILQYLTLFGIDFGFKFDFFWITEYEFQAS
jgi:hypothetical protein